jgi:hypothetical protein
VVFHEPRQVEKMIRNKFMNILMHGLVFLGLLVAGCSPSPKGGFKRYLVAPIPPSVTILDAGGLSGLETVWGCHFEIAPSDLQNLVTNRGFVRTSISDAEQRRLERLFETFVKKPLSIAEPFEFYETHQPRTNSYPQRDYYLFTNTNHTDVYFIYSAD